MKEDRPVRIQSGARRRKGAGGGAEVHGEGEKGQGQEWRTDDPDEIAAAEFVMVAFHG
jgi:hypothetical protein